MAAVPSTGATDAHGAAPAPETRVFVGGLPAEATKRDLRDRFARFVSDAASSVELELELLPNKAAWAPTGAHRGVAFLTLSGAGAEDARDRLVKTFNRTKWRGSILRVEPARPHYLERLRQEWQARSDSRAAATVSSAPSDKPMRVAIPFAGERKKTFDDVEGEHQVESKADEDSGEDSGGSTSQDEDSGDDEENGSDYNRDNANGVHNQGDSSVGSDGGEPEAVGEDDIEQFVRQMEAEASAVEVSTEWNVRNVNGGDGTDDEAARAATNARRVAALAARQQQRQQKEEQQRQLVAAAVSTGTKSKKITFDDDGEAQVSRDDNDEEPAGGNVSSEHLVTDWLDSDSEQEGEDDEAIKAMDPEDRELLPSRSTSEKKSTLDFLIEEDGQERGDTVDHNEDDDTAKAFALRPEFLGESGKKLFEMQKRFGGDQRFRLDARFMEDDEFAAGNDDTAENDEAMDDDVGEVQAFLDEDGRDDAAARELAWRTEQDTALAAIEKIFPDLDVAKIKHRLRVQATKDPIKEASWMGRMQRYDPRDASSRRVFEITTDDVSASHNQARSTAEEDEAARRKTERESKPVVVGGDRFFATSNTLGSLFTRVRKNSEDGIEGEAALDGVFGFGSNVGGDGGGVDNADATEADGASTFKLSSLFDFPVEDEKKIASMGESLLEQDEEHEKPDEPWHFTQAFQDHEDAPDGEEDVATDGEDEDASTVDSFAKSGVTTKTKRTLEEFLAFGLTFVRKDSDDNDAKEWAEHRKRLTIDFKRKRRDALKAKKKQQQQFAKKKPHRA